MRKIKAQLSKILNIHDEDWKPLLVLQLFIVSICSIIANLKTVSNALFVANIGAQNLPLTYMGCAIALIISGILLLPLVDKVQRHSVYIITVVSLSIFVFTSYLMIQMDQKWIFYFLYIISYIVDTILFLEFWLIAADICDSRQAKRVFPLIIGWSLVGGMIGAFGTKFLVKYFKTSELLLISGSALLLTILIIYLIRMLFTKEITFEASDRKTGGVSKMARLKMDVNILKDSPLLKYICISFILYSFLTYLLDFQFNMAASAHFTIGGKISTEPLTAFYGMFDGICISAALFFQFFVANRFLNAFGVANSQLILPSVFAAGFSGILLNLFPVKTGIGAQPFYSTILTRFGQKVTSSSIYRSSYNLLYNPIPKEKRGRSKAFSESLVQPAGVLLIGILIIVLKKFSPVVISSISVLIALYYIYIILKLKKAYIGSILAMFDSKNYGDLESFAGLFGKLGEKEILGKLYQVMDDKDFNIRSFIVEILGEISNKTAIEPLIKMFDAESNPKVRASIMKVLGKLGGPQVAAVIKRSLEDQDARVRANSLEAIELTKDRNLYPAIPKKLADPNNRVRATAAVLIIKLNLDRFKSEAVDALIKMFQKGDIEDKISAIYSFGAIGTDQGFEFIKEAVNDSDIRIKQRAILSLGQTRRMAAADILVELIRTSNSTIKNFATQSLITIGANALPVLSCALKDPDIHERSYIIKAIAPIYDRKNKDELVEAANDEIENIKLNRYYLERLETIPEKDAVIILTDSLRDQIIEAKENVLNILAILGGNTPSVKSIMKNIHHPNRFARANAIEALEQIGEKEIVKELIPLIESEQTKKLAPSIKQADQNALEYQKTIRDLLKSNYKWIRASAVFSMGKLKAAGCKEDLIKMMDDSYALVRANVIEALKSIGLDNRAMDAIRKGKNDPDPVVRLYAEMAVSKNG